MIPLKFSKGEFKDFLIGAAVRGDESAVPDSPGVYAVLRIKDSRLVYVGAAKGKLRNKPRSLRDRFFKQHFKEKAWNSPLRRQVARELGLPPAKGLSGPPARDPKQERKITRYMENELCFSFIATTLSRVDDLEISAIAELKPQWNL